MKRFQITLAIFIFAAVAPLTRAQESVPSPVGVPESEKATPPSVSPDSASIVPGQLVHKVIPKYPKEARKANVEGRVVLRARVDPSGRVMLVSLKSGELALAEDAIDALYGWRFKPYTQDGKPVEVQQEVTFNFAAGKKSAELEPLPPATLIIKQSGAPPKGLSTGDGVFRVGKGVTAPKAIYAPDPQYSDKARKAKYQGVCVVSLIVGADGAPRDVKVVQAIGRGLDAKAVEAVQQWEFEPAKKDGQPVAVAINVEVTFRLY
jgi:TonB family protein